MEKIELLFSQREQGVRGAIYGNYFCMLLSLPTKRERERHLNCCWLKRNKKIVSRVEKQQFFSTQKMPITSYISVHYKFRATTHSNA
mgnify:CR=1